MVAEKRVTNRRQDTADNEAVLLRHPPWQKLRCEQIYGGNDGTLDTRRTSPSGHEASDISCAESSTTGGHSHDRLRPNIHWRVARVVIPVHNRHGIGESSPTSIEALRWTAMEENPVKATAVRTEGFEDHNRQLRFVQRKRPGDRPAAQADVAASEYVPMGLSMLGKASKRAQAAKKGKGKWRPERQRQRRGRQGRQERQRQKKKSNDNAEVTG